MSDAVESPPGGWDYAEKISTEPEVDLFPGRDTCCEIFRSTGSSHDPHCSWWS